MSLDLFPQLGSSKLELMVTLELNGMVLFILGMVALNIRIGGTMVNIMKWQSISVNKSFE